MTDPALTRRIPLGRIGTPDDIASMTGATFRVDGGLGLISWFDPAE